MFPVRSHVAMLLLGFGLPPTAFAQCPIDVRSAPVRIGDPGEAGANRGQLVLSVPLTAGSYRVTAGTELAEPPQWESTLTLTAPCDTASFPFVFTPAPEPRGLADLIFALGDPAEPSLRFVQQIVRDGVTPVPALGPRDLLERYAPVLRLDRDETQEPVPAEFLMDLGLLRTAGGDTLSWPADVSRPRFLGSHPDRTGYLDLPGSTPEETMARIAAAVNTLAPERVVYGTVATDPTRPGRIFLQYWFCWAYNDWVNTHEGDWEHATVILESDGRVVGVNYAQHGYEYPVPATRVPWEGSRPLVFVARGSHASYPRSGATFAFVGTDEHGGDGPTLRPGSSGRQSGAYRLVPLARSGDAPTETDAWGPVPEPAWAPFSGGWGSPFEITAPGEASPAPRDPASRSLPALARGLGALEPDPVFLPGPVFRGDWIRPSAPVTVLVASLVSLGTTAPAPAFRVTAPGGGVYSSDDPPTAGRRFEVGRASAPAFGVALAWLTVHDWTEGTFHVEVDPVSQTMLVGSISWEGLVVRSQGDPPTEPVTFEVVDPEPLDITTPVALLAAPNPFRSALLLRVPRAAQGVFGLSLFDVQGRRTQTWSGAHPGGAFAWGWDGRLDDGRLLAGGVYFVRVRFSDETVLTTRVVRVP